MGNAAAVKGEKCTCLPCNCVTPDCKCKDACPHCANACKKSKCMQKACNKHAMRRKQLPFLPSSIKQGKEYSSLPALLSSIKHGQKRRESKESSSLPKVPGFNQHEEEAWYAEADRNVLVLGPLKFVRQIGTPKSSAAPKRSEEWTSNDRRAAYARSKSSSDSRIWTSNERRAAYGASKSRSDSMLWTSDDRKTDYDASKSSSDGRRAAYGASKSRSLPTLESCEQNQSPNCITSIAEDATPPTPIQISAYSFVAKDRKPGLSRMKRSLSKMSSAVWASRISVPSETSAPSHSFGRHVDCPQAKYRRSQSLT